MQKLLKSSENFYKFLITALLIFVPLYPKFPTLRIFGSYVSVRVEDFLILLVVICFLPLIISELKSLLKKPVVRAILLYSSVGLLSVLAGTFLTQTVDIKIGLLHLFRRIEYISLFFVGLVYVKNFYSKEFTEYLIKILLVVNLLIFAYGVGQRYLNFPVIVTQNAEYSKGIALQWVPGAHINSTFAGHYDLASYLVLVLPLFILSMFVYKSKTSKFIFAVSSVFGFWLLSMAASRIAVAALFGSVFILFILFRKYKELLLTSVVLLLFFGTSPDLQVRYKRLFDVIMDKISIVKAAYAADSAIIEDRSSSIRFNVEWPRAIRAFTKNPLIGTGYSSITLATDNGYLRLLGEVGLLGFASFILVIFNIFRPFLYLFRMPKLEINSDNVFNISFISSLIGILLVTVFIDIFEASKFAIMFWLFAGVVMGNIYKTTK